MLTSHFVVIGDLQSPVSCHKECLLMIRLEDNIRDFLAEHLEMLEEGLRLVRKEFRLPNPGGAGGRIDIVAQDRLGHFAKR
jgi:RecB family endonuclease NucS